MAANHAPYLVCGWEGGHDGELDHWSAGGSGVTAVTPVPGATGGFVGTANIEVGDYCALISGGSSDYREAQPYAVETASRPRYTSGGYTFMFRPDTNPSGSTGGDHVMLPGLFSKASGIGIFPVWKSDKTFQFASYHDFPTPKFLGSASSLTADAASPEWLIFRVRYVVHSGKVHMWCDIYDEDVNYQETLYAEGARGESDPCNLGTEDIVVRVGKYLTPYANSVAEYHVDNLYCMGGGHLGPPIAPSFTVGVATGVSVNSTGVTPPSGTDDPTNEWQEITNIPPDESTPHYLKKITGIFVTQYHDVTDSLVGASDNVLAVQGTFRMYPPGTFVGTLKLSTPLIQVSETPPLSGTYSYGLYVCSRYEPGGTSEWDDTSVDGMELGFTIVRFGVHDQRISQAIVYVVYGDDVAVPTGPELGQTQVV